MTEEGDFYGSHRPAMSTVQSYPNKRDRVSLNPAVQAVKIAQRLQAIQTTDREALAKAEAYFKGKVVKMNPDGTGAFKNHQDYLRFKSYQITQLTAEIYRQWESIGRQTLAIHPELVQAIKFSRSSKIVPEIFRTLPYFNPMVIFPEPVVMKSYMSKETMKAIGFFCFGKAHVQSQSVNLEINLADYSMARFITDTHDPQAIGFGAMLVVEVYSESGELIDYEMDRLTFPLEGPPRTIEEIVEEHLESFQWESDYHYMDESGEQLGTEHKKKFMREVFKVVIGSIMYLCSTTLEAEKIPKKFVQKHATKTSRRPNFSMYKVGWQIGAALSASRRAVSTSETPSSQEKGYEQDPQHRKAHFKTVWTGRGCTIPKTVFIAPYWTHVEKLGPVGVNTARAVRV